MSPYLVKVAGRKYRYQRYIPKDISWVWKGKVIICSLKTSLKRTAADMAKDIDGKIEKIFADARLGYLTPSEAASAITGALINNDESGELMLEEAAKRYEAHKGVGWNAKGKNEFWANVNLVAEKFGKRPIRLLDDKLVEKVRDDLIYGGVQPVTVNKYLSRVSAVLNWCVKKRIIQHNPIPSCMYTISKNEKKTASYKPYDDSDIKWIAEEMLEHPGRSRWCTYMYWLPLLGMFTGARVGDLCDLTKSSFEKRGHNNDVLVVNIGNQKTGDTPRVVPIHSKLIELGFDKWVESLKDGESLFSVTRRGDDGQYDYKWYGRQLRKKISDPQKVFHSFRSTISNRLNNQGVSATHRADILGHERKTDTETDASYTPDTAVESLKADIELLEYPTVDWSKVKIKSSI